MADELKLQEAGDDTFREEVESELSEDETRLGEVWRLRRQGLKPKEIAEKLGVDTWEFFYNQRRNIKAIVEGILPDSPNPAKQCGSTLRGFINKHRASFSNATVSLLLDRADECARRANDLAKREEQEQKPEYQTIRTY